MLPVRRVRILVYGIVAAFVGFGCSTTPGDPDGGGAGGVGGTSSSRGGSGGGGAAGAGGGSAGSSAGGGGAAAVGGGGAGGAAGQAGSSGSTGSAGRGGSGGRGGTSGGGGSTGAGGSAGRGGSGGQGVVCGGGRCAAGEMCCYDIMGNGACASPPAVCIGGPAVCSAQQVCTGGLFCDMNQPRRCLASAVGGICIETPTACPRNYQPVCGCDGVTYGNDCERRRAHAQLDHEGECAAADGGSRD